VSVRNRKPVFFEIGHTIMNLLADFRNYQYMLQQIRGVTIHMQDKHTTISFPRNRYSEVSDGSFQFSFTLASF
jgi:MAD (mothers against decapentaplegic) interacting protein